MTDSAPLKLTVAICTYNRGERLPALIANLRAQSSKIPFGLLFVNNNSTDGTEAILDKLAAEPGAPLRHVLETRQGISYARNRAIEETLAAGADYMLVMDDDELPRAGWVEHAVRALVDTGADCVGGRVRVDFNDTPRPLWLGDDLLGFLAEVDYGDEAFWILDKSTPVWTANVAYNMRLFRENEELRFDYRYNREGDGVGGGEDVIMFETLLDRGCRVRYEPAMVVDHGVEAWRLHRRYFLKLHYVSGLRQGRWELPDYSPSLCGIAPFMLVNTCRHALKALRQFALREPTRIRQAMNFTHSLGILHGRQQYWHSQRSER